jgi:hypothetical protein
MTQAAFLRMATTAQQLADRYSCLASVGRLYPDGRGTKHYILGVRCHSPIPADLDHGCGWEPILTFPPRSSRP